jgi:hypothetical protein
VRIWAMAQEVCVMVGAEDRARLAAVVGDRRRSLKHVQRARIVLLSAERCRFLRSPAGRASAGRRSGAGSGAMAKKASMASCATRRGHPASRDCPQRPWPRCWP